MITVYIILSAVVAVLCHRFCRSFLAAIALAAVSATVLWFALTLPLALTDGWAGWTTEIPYMARAAAICLAIAFGIALAVGGTMRWAVRPEA